MHKEGAFSPSCSERGALLSAADHGSHGQLGVVCEAVGWEMKPEDTTCFCLHRTVSQARDNDGWSRLESLVFPAYFWKGAAEEVLLSCCPIPPSSSTFLSAPFPAGFFFLITRPGNYLVLLFILMLPLL